MLLEQLVKIIIAFKFKMGVKTRKIKKPENEKQTANKFLFV
jgi:hypothetical protein